MLCFALPQRLLGPLVLGDVLVGAVHPFRFAVFGQCGDLAPVEHPYPLAVFMTHAAFVVVVLRSALETSLQQPVRLLQVVGVREFDPGVDGHGGNLFERVADDVGPALVEDGLAGLDVPLPGADVRAPENVVEPLLLVDERLFRAYAPSDVLPDSQ